LLEAAIPAPLAVHPKLNAIIIQMHYIARSRAKEKTQAYPSRLAVPDQGLFQEYPACRPRRPAMPEGG